MRLRTSLKLIFSATYWRRHWWDTMKGLMRGLLWGAGTLWLAVEIVSYFSDPTVGWMQAHWYLFLFGSLFIAALRGWPAFGTTQSINDRDIIIELRVGDVFDFDGTVVIPTNSTFDTDLDGLLIEGRSMQATFFRNNYSDLNHLNADIVRQLDFGGYCGIPVASVKPGKQTEYPIGTTIHLKGSKQEAYWLAASQISKSGRAHGTIQNVLDALPRLWEFIGGHGGFGTVIVPVLGTGMTRTVLKIDDAVHEIVKSFIAATSETRFSDHLIIVIHHRDYRKHTIDLQALCDFVEAACRWAPSRRLILNGEVGTALGDPSGSDLCDSTEEQ